MARDYKKEYRRDQASPARRKYRAELNARARKDGHYGKTPKGKDLVHKGGKIKGLGDRRENRQDGARKATAARIRNRKKKKK